MNPDESDNNIQVAKIRNPHVKGRDPALGVVSVTTSEASAKLEMASVSEGLKGVKSVGGTADDGPTKVRQ